jgi:DNA (cytosine-5)-methyltransferase 1
VKPRLLDLFCGAGGAGWGYHLAGFDVIGVDTKPMPNYPFDFIRADAMMVLETLATGRCWPWKNHWGLGVDTFDVIHASPPCPRYSLVSGFQGVAENHPDLIGPTRDLLAVSGRPWVMENVPGAPLRHDVTLCGEMFGLRVHRHRIFETSGFFAMQPPHSRHNLRGGKTNCETGPGVARWITGHYADHEDALDAMGIDWMDRDGLRNAIPPAYTEHIGAYLMAEVNARATA